MLEPTPETVERPLTFSLRTVFFIVTCGAVASGGYAFGDKHDAIPLATALFALGLFLTASAAFKRRLLTAVGLLCASALVCPFAVPPRATCVYSRQTNCLNDLREVGLAIVLYEQTHGSMPPAFTTDTHGEPLASWRAAILSELGRPDLKMAFHDDEPWNSPNNAATAAACLPIFKCSSDAAEVTKPTTNYLAIVGRHTCWPGAKGRKLSEIKNPAKTILLIEVADTGINWAEPRDLTVADVLRGINPKNGIGPSSHHNDGINVLYADGHVEFLPADTDPKKLAAMCDINGSDYSTTNPSGDRQNR
jgi:prepilin-type processing-associated H-X9-DG protein